MELLAPAGNFECLKVAVACGADAVYLGMQKYGARAAADNFSRENLRDAVEFAHLHNVKIHLTVNTLIKDSEMSDALDTVEFATNSGVDAFIVQDAGLIYELRKRMPNLTLHASTQMGICNLYGAKQAEKLGFSRVVLARETLADDIREIKSKTNLQIETFCHGALCVAFSGNCYYSSIVSGCSGNRGRCLQLCRKKYLRNGKSGYFLSAKDICLADKIDMLKELGVDSVKIEGRMRSAEYVAQTVSVYRKAIDGKFESEDMEKLKLGFNRGDYCKAYFVNPTENVIYPKVQNNIGIFAGTVKSIKNGKALIDSCVKLNCGDGVKYLNNGCEVGGGLIDGNPTRYAGNVKIGNEVRLTSSVNLKNEISKLNPVLFVDISVLFLYGGSPAITATCNNIKASVLGEQPLFKAERKPICKDDIANAIGKLGGTEFTLRNLHINLDNDVFYPVSAIKEMRKRVISDLKDKLLNSYIGYSDSPKHEELPQIHYFDYKKSAVFVTVQSADTIGKIDFGYDYVILNPTNYDNFENITNDCKKLNGKAILNLPEVLRGRDLKIAENIKQLPIAAVIANNISHLALFDNFKIIAGIGLNVLNSRCYESYINSAEGDLAGNGITYAYGKMPLMTFAHCPKKNHGGNCKECNGYNVKMTDDKGADIEVSRVKLHYCYGKLILSAPINNIDCVSDSAKIIDLTYATDSEIKAVNGQMNGKPYGLPVIHGNINKKLR